MITSLSPLLEKATLPSCSISVAAALVVGGGGQLSAGGRALLSPRPIRGMPFVLLAGLRAGF